MRRLEPAETAPDAPGLIESSPGGIRIELARGGSGSRARLASNRPVHAVRVFERWPSDTALRMLPRLFGVCGQAHRAAAAAALGLHTGGAGAALRAETLREHLLRVHLDGPALLGLRPRVSLMPRLLRACERVGESADEACALLERHTLGIAPHEFLRIDDPGALRAWSRRHAASSPAAALLEHVAGLPRLLPVDEPDRLAEVDLDQLRERIDGPDGDAFVARPELDGACRQTGPYARHADSALLRELRAAGEPLQARLAARLRELALYALSEPEPPCRGDGIARVETSRGTLVHRVLADAQGRIARWRVLAPTEWNFHPRGAAACLLDAIPSELADAQREHLARLVVHAVDPCVAFELRLRSAGDADA